VEACCITVEQSEEWIKMRLNNGISQDYINIVTADVEKIWINNFETLVYKNLETELEKFKKKFNLILIDGPWGSENYSRFNIIKLVENELIDRDFIIIMDDHNRKGEQETIDELKLTLTRFNYQFIIGHYSGDKSQIVIASKKFGYLESL
jgi:16S rRNA G966 N2-methylase RsmD